MEKQKRDWFSILCVLGIVVLLLLYELVVFQRNKETAFSAKPYDFHLVLITATQNQAFWDQVEVGAMPRTKLNNALLERQEIDPQQQSVAQAIEAALQNQVDGIMTFVPEEEDITEAVNKAVLKNIPVITLEQDAPQSDRQSHIGVDSARLGEHLGRVITATVRQQPAHIVFAGTPDFFASQKGTAISQQLLPVLQSLEQSTVETKDSSDLAAILATLAEEAGEADAPVPVLVCSSAEESEQAGLFVQEHQLQQKLSVIGIGQSPQLLKLIEDGIVYATVTGDGVSVGADAAKNMFELLVNNWTREFIFPDTLAFFQQNARSQLITD